MVGKSMCVFPLCSVLEKSIKGRESGGLTSKMNDAYRYVIIVCIAQINIARISSVIESFDNPANQSFCLELTLFHASFAIIPTYKECELNMNMIIHYQYRQNHFP